MAAPMIRKNAIIVIYISGFLDLFGVSMILPLITSHARDLGASPTVSGILGSVYGALQLFTSPLVGQWSDVAGRRFALLVCLFMSAGGYSIFAMATSVSLMFIARLPLGIFKHSQNISKAYLADIITDSEQAAVIGNFNAVSSVGFIVGPVVGGHVAERKGGFYLVALLAGLIFFINFVLVWLIVPTEKAHHEMKKSLASSTSLKALQSDEINFNSKTFWQAAKDMNWKDLWDLYFIKFLLGASVIIYRSNFSLVLVQKFETSPITNGYIISFNGIVSAFVGLFTGYISSYYTSNAKLVLHLAIMQVFTMISLSVSPSLWLYTLFLVPLCFATTITRVAATKLMLERGNKKDIGILMGFQQSCMSVARMLAPLVAGISQEVTSSGPSIMGAGFSLVAVIIMCWRPQDPRERKKYE
ncbi:major facilitator superfamily domain-containing protein 9-like isoform X1 [Mya arenaria]|uniref:major facilitator superfamily domain-containing protein 9-like isoform X1 n=2 Tax=Mya arenaria TaxID=6604 RepID=UPI0022E7E7A0|nr:major facilitator superfamily domain-containing protein 9-like isoform X1 [Mya arenaria]